MTHHFGILAHPHHPSTHAIYTTLFAGANGGEGGVGLGNIFFIDGHDKYGNPVWDVKGLALLIKYRQWYAWCFLI